MYYQSKLSNGITLLTIPAKNTLAVTILVLLPIGSRHETSSLRGASHFIEHMMFKGTVKRQNNFAIAKELDSIGAHYNAFTSKDHTGYWIKVIKEKIDVGFDILSDMLFNSVFDKKEFDREKGVIAEEIKMYKENPLLYISDFFDSILYKGNTLANLISGSRYSVHRLARAPMVRYKERFYQPNHMVIAVAGDVRKADIVSRVEKYFYASHNKGQKNTYIPFEKSNAPLSQRVGLCFKYVDQVHIALGGFSYPYSHPLREPLALLLTILGGNMSSRLFSEVRVKRGLAYFVKADADVYADIGSYTISAGVDKGKAIDTIRVILDELKKVQKYGVSKEELKRAKDYFEGSLKLSLEDSADLVSWYGRQALLGTKILSPSEKLQKIKNVTVRDIYKVARAVLKREKMRLALIGPFKNKKPFLRVLEKGV